MQEVFCYVIYKLKPVISITLGEGLGGGEGAGLEDFWGSHDFQRVLRRGQLSPT